MSNRCVYYTSQVDPSVTRTRLLKIAKRMGFREMSEDIAQEAYLVLMRRQTTLQFAVVEAARKLLGRYPHRKLKFVNPVALESIGVDDKMNEVTLPKDKVERAMMILKYVFEFSNAEIGLIFGYAENSVNAMVWGFRNKCRTTQL